MTDDAPKCTTCDRELAFVEDVESEAYGTGSQRLVPHRRGNLACPAIVHCQGGRRELWGEDRGH
jgi:hypothetical protein